jgi:hypothetical protein
MKFLNINYLLIICFSCVYSACESDDVQKLDKRDWKLTWSDEFEGVKDQAPDPKKWTYDLGTGQNGWGNGEYQTYTNRSTEDLRRRSKPLTDPEYGQPSGWWAKTFHRPDGRNAGRLTSLR